jgi:hypothetical protein
VKNATKPILGVLLHLHMIHILNSTKIIKPNAALAIQKIITLLTPVLVAMNIRKMKS